MAQIKSVLRRRRRATRLLVEQLEDRTVLHGFHASAACSLANGLLETVCSQYNDVIHVRLSPDSQAIEVREGGHLVFTAPISEVNELRIDGGQGDDLFILDDGLNIPVVIDGQAGLDTVRTKSSSLVSMNSVERLNDTDLLGDGVSDIPHDHSHHDHAAAESADHPEVFDHDHFVSHALVHQDHAVHHAVRDITAGVKILPQGAYKFNPG